eukprot:CAMPEP_0117685930 /NCGR_PEP_ID=MMETSP0804-20121206/22092_1 /TAXON_ID=1074897 /ORGANISM="Tetraselmis astigmatica, Strain CCMP880" /LENGTH=95 /DNA_ID=CAMNT_0005497415 /DNA_START=12 /DNA_END=299 /DNA_ORIENTATION=-
MDAAGGGWQSTSWPGGSAASSGAPPTYEAAGRQSEHQSSPEDEVRAENQVLRALLRQQEQVEELKQSNNELREALCKLDPEAEICKTGRGGRRRR